MQMNKLIITLLLVSLNFAVYIIADGVQDIAESERVLASPVVNIGPQCGPLQ